MDEFDPFAPQRSATNKRPLLGMTVLVVEDSRFACEMLRQMCLRSGARIRRADCLRSARRHLRVYRPSIAIVDLGLPDGSGADLIEELDHAAPRVGVVLGLSGDDQAESTAIGAGADGFLSKPIRSLARFQQTIVALLPAEFRPTGPRAVSDDPIDLDPVAYRDDMTHVANLLSDHDDDGPVVDYVTQFLDGVARSADDSQLADAASDLAETREKGLPWQGKLSRLSGLIDARLQKRLAI